MPDMTLRIAHLYYNLLTVAGDRGNLFAIQRRSEWRGIKTEVTDVGVGVHPDFTNFDIILIQGGQDVEMNVAAPDLVKKAASLRDAVENDTVVLAVCAGYQLLGNYYQPISGDRLEGVGILDMRTEGEKVRYMNHIVMECDFSANGPQTIVGFENHSGRTYLGPKAQPLGKVLAGAGNNGKDGGEGARYREVYGTYLHGPILPRNPWFADHIIWKGLQHRYGAVPPLGPLRDDAEAKAHESALRLALKFRGRTSALEATSW